MRAFITGVFSLAVSLWILCSIVVGVAWLFNSQPNNLHLVWIYLRNFTAITFLFHLLFGGKEE